MNEVPKIGLIDADLLDNGTRHPNLALMKISRYCKKFDSHLIFSEDELNNLEQFDIIIVSKVFTFSKLPIQLDKLITKRCKNLKRLNICIKKAIKKYYKNNKLPILAIGGTGFFEDGGIDLDYEIEHEMPDYDLYNEYIDEKVRLGRSIKYYDDYINYSIGFTTRGCFRKCDFCVNKKYDQCIKHAEVSEFMNPKRPKIYLWDDNIFANSQWSDIFDELNATGKPFQFRQGLDIRLLNEKKALKLSQSRYYGDIIFAFDHVDDYDLIESKLKLWRSYSKHTTKLYVLCAFDSWTYHEHPEWIKLNQIHLQEISKLKTQKERDEKDIEGIFIRIKLIMKYGCLPYIMRYEKYNDSEYRDVYIQIARWCNQPQFFKKMSFRQFCLANEEVAKRKKFCASYRAMVKLEMNCPEISKKYMDMRYEEIKEY